MNDSTSETKRYIVFWFEQMGETKMYHRVISYSLFTASQLTHNLKALGKEYIILSQVHGQPRRNVVDQSAGWVWERKSPDGQPQDAAHSQF